MQSAFNKWDECITSSPDGNLYNEVNTSWWLEVNVTIANTNTSYAGYAKIIQYNKIYRGADIGNGLFPVGARLTMELNNKSVLDQIKANG